MKERLKFYYQKFQNLPPFFQALIVFTVCVFFVFLSDIILNAFVFKKSQETGFIPRLSPPPLPTLSPTPTATVSAQGKIAFVRDGDIWMINLDGSRERKITNFEQYTAHPSHRQWGDVKEYKISLDGRRIAYLRNTDDTVKKAQEMGGIKASLEVDELDILDLESGAISRIATKSAPLSMNFLWSPGQWDILVYDTWEDNKRDLNFYYAHSGQSGKILENFHPLSKQLNFIRGTIELMYFLRNTLSAQSNLSQLVVYNFGRNTEKVLVDLDVARDGWIEGYDFLTARGRIIYLTSNGKVVTVYIDGREPKAVGEIGLASQISRLASPKWSLDGKKMVYEVHSGLERDLWLFDLESKMQVNLTKLYENVLLDERANEITNTTWSSDGESLLVEVLRREETGLPCFETSCRKVYFLKVDGSDARKIVDNASQPAWSPK